MANPNPNPKGRFKKGQSGNPQGAKALPLDVREGLKVNAPAALAKLWELTDSADEDVRLKALIAYLKKCVPDLSSVEVSGPDGSPIGIAVGFEDSVAKVQRAIEAAKASHAKDSA